MNLTKNDKCNSCQNLEKYLDDCDGCGKLFCYECMGRIKNSLYCEPCYRKKEGLKNSDEIIKSIEKVDDYRLDEKGNKVKTEMKTTIYCWNIKKNSDK